jgi:hypothetical protein
LPRVTVRRVGQTDKRMRVINVGLSGQVVFACIIGRIAE